jgi:hydroxymethylbilane synthase
MIIGTRGSRLALWQAEHVRDRLAAAAVADIELRIIRTQGDRIQNVTFDKLEGKGFFTSELEKALEHGEVDVAVHSLKDLPTEQPGTLTLGAIPARADAADMLLVRPGALDAGSPLGLRPDARVGTSSNRRRVQLVDRAPALVVLPLRGNVPTRLARLVEGRFDAIVLAAAGLQRLGLLDEAREAGLILRPLELHEMVPAPGQGALGIQCRRDDERTLAALASLHDPGTARSVALERELLAALGGGCQLPLGAFCRPDRHGRGFELWAAWSAAAPPPAAPVGTDLLSGPATVDGPLPPAEPVRVVRVRAAGEAGLVEQVAAALRRKSGGPGTLEGRAVWITSGDDESARELSERLRRRGAAVELRPLVRRQSVPAGDALRGLAGSGLRFDLCFFPSRTAVARLAEELRLLGHEALRGFPPTAAARTAAMGPATARAAAGLLGVGSVDFQASGEGSAELAARLLAEPWAGSPPSALVPRAQDGRTELQELLRGAGWQVVELDLYRTEPQPPAPEDAARLTPESVVLLGSPSAARALLSAVQDAHPLLVTIGPTTTQAVLDSGAEVECQAPAASADGLEEALLWAPHL